MRAFTKEVLNRLQAEGIKILEVEETPGVEAPPVAAVVEPAVVPPALVVPEVVTPPTIPQVFTAPDGHEFGGTLGRILAFLADEEGGWIPKRRDATAKSVYGVTDREAVKKISGLVRYYQQSNAEMLGHGIKIESHIVPHKVRVRGGKSFDWISFVPEAEAPVEVSLELQAAVLADVITEDIDRVAYAIKSNRKSLSPKPLMKNVSQEKRPAAAVVSRPIITPDSNKVLAAQPRDFYRISEESKIGDFRDHVAQEPGLYLAAWHDEDIRSLLRCKDKAVVDAFWDNYCGNVLLAVRELIKSCQFPNLTFEAAYREINTVLADIYQIVKDKEDEETHHNDNGNPHADILAEITPILNGKNGSLTKRDSKEMVDKATVVMAQTGDHAAFERIVQHYWSPIYNFVYRMMGNPEDTFDFTQDTFMKAYLALPRTSHDLRLGSWIYRIATNNCLDELRHRKLIHWQPWESFISVFHPSQISRDNPERDVLNGENQEEIQAILDRLYPRYRACLILRHYHDFSYDEIAEALNTTMASVKTLLFRAREEFRQVYARTERKPVSAA